MNDSIVGFLNTPGFAPMMSEFSISFIPFLLFFFYSYFFLFRYNHINALGNYHDLNFEQPAVMASKLLAIVMTVQEWVKCVVFLAWLIEEGWGRGTKERKLEKMKKQNDLEDGEGG